MGGLSLLREAYAAGLTAQRDGDRLRVRGPRRAEEYALALLRHKAAVLPLLDRLAPLETGGRLASRILEGRIAEWHIAAVGGDFQAELATWTEALRERFEERAAIREFDGGFPRAEAERLAFGDVRNRK